MAENDRISVGSDRRLDREGPGAALAPRKDAIGRIGADRAAAETGAVATVAGGMVLGAFYPAEAKAALVGAAAAPTTPADVETTDRPLGAHGDALHEQTDVPEAAPVLHEAAALIQAEGNAVLARLEAAFDAATTAIGAPASPAGQGDPVPQAAPASGSSTLPSPSDGHAVHAAPAGVATDGLNTVQSVSSDAALGDHGVTAGLPGTGAAPVPSVAGVVDTVAQTLGEAASTLPNGLDHIVGTVEGQLTTLSGDVTAPLLAVTDATGDILAPAANLTQVAGDIAAPVLGEVADIASGPVVAVTSLVAEVPATATNLVEGTVGTVQEHAATAVPDAVDGVVSSVALPLDLPSLNLGFLGQSYSDLGHGEVGPHHDQGLLHGLV